MSANRSFWRLAASTNVQKFIEYLTDATELRVVRIEFPYRPLIRYVWGEADSLPVIQSLNIKGYFSHYTAVLLHGLTEQLPKAVYFNQEQASQGGGEGTLRQQAINNAFRGKCRTTTNVAPFRGQTVTLLNGRNTGQTGVTEVIAGSGVKLRTTTVERTLIDAVVRPIYTGGIFEVAKAFARARDDISVNKLTAMLKRLNFTYPYHQSIGYLLERAGVYKKSQLDLLRQFPREVDFFLDYGMKNPDYNADWRLFIPKGF